MTVLEAIQLSTGFLEKKGIESARLNAELMIADILKCKRFDLYVNFEKILLENEVDALREYLKRRGKNEPLQYILGEVEFYGLPFKVNTSVLIPRPDTETLIETILEKYKEKENLTIIDIGTGSGIIAICLAKYLKTKKIISIDISEEAIKTAKENASLNNVAEKINFINKDIFEISPDDLDNADIIVSNPPYISIEDSKELMPELVLYEPRMAYCDESDGYRFYRLISNLSAQVLKPEGRIFYEAGIGQYTRISEILNQNGFQNIEIIKDYGKIERVISGQKI